MPFLSAVLTEQRLPQAQKRTDGTPAAELKDSGPSLAAQGFFQLHVAQSGLVGGGAGIQTPVGNQQG